MLDLTEIVEEQKDKGVGIGVPGEEAQGPPEDGVLSHFEVKVSQEEALDPLYEGIKDDDVGSLTPIAEHHAEHELTLVADEADLTLSYLNGGTDTDLMDQLLSDGDLGQNLSPGFLETEDPTAVRDGFIAQIKVLDAMLEHVGFEEEQRGILDVPQADTHSKVASLNYEPAVENVNLKRQRRPNPKYFDTGIEGDLFFSAPGQPFRPYKEELLVSAAVYSGKAIFRECEEEDGTTEDNDRPAYSQSFDCCSALPAGTHRARTALAHKPRVFSTPTVPGRSTEELKTNTHLEKLSIRELHEAYRATFGKDTSVKDKHWLKRQIYMGSKKQKNMSGIGKENSRANDTLEANVKVREDSSAEMPLAAFVSNGHGLNREHVGRVGSSTRMVINTPAVPPKRAHRKTLSLAVLSPSNPSTFFPTVEGRETAGKSASLEDVQEKGMTGKRLRRPNRRYMDDEGDDSLGFNINVGPAVISKYLSSSNGLRSRKSESESVGDKHMYDTAKSMGYRGSTRSLDHKGRRNDYGTNTSATSKAERRAAKIIKLAHSHRSGRHDADGVGSVRKVKFKLPAASGQEKGELMNGGDGEQVSCVLPVLRDGSPDDYRSLGSPYLNRLDDNSEQPVLTVPTANGGTRRKHHRPWTLEEVVTLVEGVAHCGGGKWAEIKKLYFASLPYRTAVDLKDKWRNLLRASQVELHQPKQGETRKKQFSASIPAYILARVRELAGLNSQIVGAFQSGSSSTTRNARIVNRK